MTDSSIPLPLVAPTACAACAAAAADELAPVCAATLTPAEPGTPTVVPLTLKLLALATENAATNRLPATRTPAAPASTVPRGAIRNTSGAGMPGAGSKAAIPAPVTPPDEFTCDNRSSSICTTIG